MNQRWQREMTMEQAVDVPLGQLLMDRAVISESDLQRALQWQADHGHQHLIGEVLQRLDLATEEDVASALAESFGVPFISSVAKTADPAVIELLPRSFIEEHRVLPLFLIRGVLTVAVEEPSNLLKL